MSFLLENYNNPFEALRSLQEDLERFWWEQSPFYDRNNISAGDVYPPVNIFEKSDDVLELQAELPGINKSDLRISLQDRLITIDGTRACYDEKEDKLSFHRRERSEGKFSRQFRLPYPVNPDTVKAVLEDGVLRIELEKAPEAKGREIKING